MTAMTDDRLAERTTGAPEMSNYPIPHGWKLVPIEPTERMAQSVYDGTGSLYDFCTVYRAMLDAAPEPPAVKDSLTGEGER